MSKVITVHEIGYSNYNQITTDCADCIICGEHFIKFPNPKKRNIVTTSIKTIENFELPVYRFKRHHFKRWLLFDENIWEYKKVDTARGSIITFVDGSSIGVMEFESTIINMINNS